MSKFILSSLLFLLLLGIVSSQDLTSVTGNNGFVTSTDLRSIYTQGDGGGHKAELLFKTNMQSLNPDLSGVAGIDCNDNKITFSLNDESSIEQINNWPDKVFLLISHRWSCFGEQTTQYYTVGDRIVDSPNKKVTFTAEKSDIKDVTEEFSVEISWDEGNGGKKKKRHIRNRGLRRRQDVDVSKKISLNVLFDEGTGKSSKPNFPLIGLEQNNTSETLVCENCFTNGEATISMRVAGKMSPFELNDATISINGNFKLNLDIAINGKVGTTISPPDVQVLSVPLNPLNVPGLFNIGPSIDLIGSAKISADVTGTFRTGSETSLPNFSAKATFVDDPTFEKSGFEPQTKSHDSSVGITVSAGISGSLKPQLAFGLDVLNGIFTAQVGFGFVTTLSSQVSVGSDSGCKEITQPHLESNLEGSLAFFVKNKDFPVLDFPTVNLLDKCL